MRWYWRNFLGPAIDAPPAWAAPLTAASLEGLPPLHLVAAGLDLLRDDTLALALRLSAAEIAHEVTTIPGVIHGFLGRAPKLPARAQRTLTAAGAFLRRHFDATTKGGQPHGTQDVS